jgi:hybrid cluster-associated redox disulfide protein
MTLAQDTVAPARIDPKALVDEAMRRWPATVGVFMRWRMKCVGCPFGVFHSIEHACEEHEQDLARFLAALEAAVA